MAEHGIGLQIVGGGRMGEALVGGLLAAGWTAPDGAGAGSGPADLVLVERLAARRTELARRFPGVRLSGEVVASDGAVVAVKPGDVPGVCAELAGAGVGRLLSIAAGVTIGVIERACGPRNPAVRVVRAMPNTPALVGSGASAVAGGTAVAEDDLAWAESILSAVGMVVRVAEPALDAVTGLSGSGPAYVFLVAESLIDAGVLVGLPRDVSTRLTVQTLLGAARLLAETDDGPAALRAAVTSPGGTTAAGLRRLEDHAVRAAFLDAVEAATERSRQLGGG
jgi:pyrroline-5-carboxylate reductase